MASTFRRIDTYPEAKALSEAGLLWYKYASTSNEWMPDPEIGYWTKKSHLWKAEYESNIQYGILLED